MAVTDELAQYALNCADIGVALARIDGGDSYFYDEFPFLIVKAGLFAEMSCFIESNGSATVSDVIEEFNRLVSENKPLE